jgi:hypothetical protein
MSLCRKPHLLPLFGLIALLLAAAPAPAQPPGPGKRPPVLFALLVVDNDSNLTEYVDADGRALSKLLNEGFATRPHRLSLEVLDRKDANPDRVLTYYRQILAKKVIAGYDTLLFYYTGHGANFGAMGHGLTMTHGRLLRNDLLRGMKALNPRLVVVLTDCCSKEVLPKSKAGAVPAPPRASWPVMDQLFFSHQGVADINGCQADSFSWCFDDDKGVARGGTFTVALVPLLCSRPENFGAKDGFVTWKLFGPRLQQDTDQFFQVMKKATLQNFPNNSIGKQANQLPELFSLADKAPTTVVDPPWLFGAVVGENPKATVAGVTIAKVYPNTPAEKAGFRANDIILKVDDRPTPTSADFVRAIDYSEGEVVVTFLRDDRQESVKVKLQPVKGPPTP